MSIFWIMAVICSGIWRHDAALIHANHVTHVRHIEHVNYERFLTTHPVVAIPLPIATPVRPLPVQTPIVSVQAPAGDYSCSALESLWVSQGGNSGSEFIAAQIATAESGGNPSAISPTSDYGLWQINSSNAPGEEMLNPIANVREAIALSGNGSNWSPWTTYTSGIYASEC